MADDYRRRHVRFSLPLQAKKVLKRKGSTFPVALLGFMCLPELPYNAKPTFILNQDVRLCLHLSFA